MIFDPPTRSRRRVLSRIIWPLLIIVAVILAIVVSAAGEETRTELDYLEQVHSQAGDLARSGDALRDVVSRLQRIERTELVTVIDGIEQDLAAGMQLVDQGAPITSLISVNALYREALASWEKGVGGFSAAVLEAADDPESTVVVDNMSDALAEMRAGDSAYRHMVRAMARDDVPEPLSPMPEVVLMPAEGSLVSLAVSYVDSARSENSGLALRPGLAVSMVVSDPEWQVNPEGQAVVPATSEITFSVVVTNAGNVMSEEVPLLLELIGGPELVRMTELIVPLDPQQQVTVVFEALAVDPSGLYEVRATLAVTGNDVSFEDNEISVEFIVNQE